MQNRWLGLVSVVLVAFAYLVVLSQFYDNNPDKYGTSSVGAWSVARQQEASTTNILDFEARADPVRAMCRRLDLGLPSEARVFMRDMIGPTNRNKFNAYGFLTYYLFPREVAVSTDQPARVTKDGFLGQPARSYQELLTRGFDVVVDTSAGVGGSFWLRPDLVLKTPTDPKWFRSTLDVVVAFLLPLLTALTGLWLVRALFPALDQRMLFFEKLGCGLGLGMMAVAALTLGVKLCGFHGRGLVLLVTSAGAVLALWSNRRAFWAGIRAGLPQTIQNPVMMVGVLTFFFLFWLAGSWPLDEGDAVMAWLLKAKILHLYTGGEIVRWFSEPRLAHAHFDYPIQVPALHAATYDSLGHINEYVTKLWPTWMLLLLIGALASMTRAGKAGFALPSFFLLALALLPATRMHAFHEGGTMPMVFFTVMGFLQCALWQVEGDRARLGLGLSLLFGAAMAKFEGFIILGAVGGWILLLPSARPSLKASPLLWRVLAFWFVAGLPFLCLRVQIPVLHYESGWAGLALRNPVVTFSHCPGMMMIMLARWFVSHDLAAWSGENGHLHWVGRWEGFSSLYNSPTLGLAWISLLMTVALWFVVPARRKLIVWMVAVILTTFIAFSVVLASFVNIMSLDRVIEYTEEIGTGRQLFPVLVAWSVTSLTLLFADPFTPTSIPSAAAKAVCTPTSAPAPD